MAIQTSEILFYKSALVTDTSVNGGRMGARDSALIADAVKNNLFPDPTQAQRLAGLTRLRKVFCAVENADSLSLLTARAHLVRTTGADDRITLFHAGQRETQSDVDAPREFGAAALASDVAAGDSSLNITLEDPSQDLFQSGDSIWIGDSVNNEYFDNVTVSGNAPNLVVTLPSGDQFANAYATDAAYVASVLPHPDTDLTAGVSDWSVISDAGTYDSTTHPLSLTNIGAVEDDWTITFTSATEYSVQGVYSGELPGGGISADYAPLNSEGGTYFTLPAGGFGGTWEAGDTITFSTHPATWGLWLRQIVPAGAAATSTSGTGLRVLGESA